jgi:hypothetical protein
LAAHDVGDLVRVWAVFRDMSGAQAAPDTVTLVARAPDGTEATVANTPAAAEDEAAAEAATGEALSGVTGVYRGDIAVDQAGAWWYRWQGIGTVSKAGESSFRVKPRRVRGA